MHMFKRGSTLMHFKQKILIYFVDMLYFKWMYEVSVIFSVGCICISVVTKCKSLALPVDKLC